MKGWHRVLKYWMLAAALGMLGRTATAGQSDIMTPSGEFLFKQALNSLYNLDYEQSRRFTRALVALEPENPFVYLAESGVIWWQSSNEYGLFKDTPTLEDIFENDIKDAISKGEFLLDASEKTGDTAGQAKGHFVIGMALGTRGEWKLLRGHWLGAYRDGKHAVKHLNQCLKLDPEFYDAYVGLGLYDYMTDQLPKALKLSMLFFIHGNAARGLERLNLAYERARYSSSYAALYLSTIYSTDKHADDKALPFLRHLRVLYPDSAFFQIQELACLLRLKDPSSLAAARSFADRIPRDPTLLGRKQLSLWCGLYGEDCFSNKGVQMVQDWLTQALDQSKERPAFWLGLLHFYRGVARDLLGRREPALSDYQYVLSVAEGAASPEWKELSSLSRHCSESACTRQETVRYLRSLSSVNSEVRNQGAK